MLQRWRLYKVAQEWHNFSVPYLLPNINRFSKSFHSHNYEKICNNTITKDPTTPQCVATLPCEMSSVLKATIENKTTSVTTHFKSASCSSKTDTLNIWCKNCRMWQLNWTITETITRCFLLLISWNVLLQKSFCFLLLLLRHLIFHKVV